MKQRLSCQPHPVLCWVIGVTITITVNHFKKENMKYTIYFAFIVTCLCVIVTPITLALLSNLPCGLLGKHSRLRLHCYILSSLCGWDIYMMCVYFIKYKRQKGEAVIGCILNNRLKAKLAINIGYRFRKSNSTETVKQSCAVLWGGQACVAGRTPQGLNTSAVSMLK